MKTFSIEVCLKIISDIYAPCFASICSNTAGAVCCAAFAGIFALWVQVLDQPESMVQTCSGTSIHKSKWGYSYDTF
ncbi:hypothetical protein D3Z47_10375 [Lachnospiraceae bacterium]|jgi:hypothetical protein|nr:hypothetical protein [Lachnospiraceae bacterium]